MQNKNTDEQCTGLSDLPVPGNLEFEKGRRYDTNRLSNDYGPNTLANYILELSPGLSEIAQRMSPFAIC